MSPDPRVEALIAWAREGSDALSGPEAGALAALCDTPASRQRAAVDLAAVAATAYSRVPFRGPGDVRTGNRVVRLLGELGEPGARELVRLRDSVRYRNARNTIEKTLGRMSRELGIPAGELEDRFLGVALNGSLSTEVDVGGYGAVIRISEDLRRVQTTWRDHAGRTLTRRPAAVAGLATELAEVDDVRRRLRSHLTALRQRLEQAMVSGRSWTVEEWATRMFADPLRAEMATRIVWRIGSTSPTLVVPTRAGLRDLDDRPVSVVSSDSIYLWHPVDDPEFQVRCKDRLDELGIDQAIAQAKRDVVLAEADSPRLSMAAGQRVLQRPFRGFLRSRGWDVPYMGRWFFIPEATREITHHGAIAVLDVDLDEATDESEDVLVVGVLGFRSILDTDLDARELPRVVVSEAARDVLGAVAVARQSRPAKAAKARSEDASRDEQ